jgi:hypothetical protein
MVKKAENVTEQVSDTLGTEEQTPFAEFIEHEKKAVNEAGKALSSLLPEGLRKHGDTALKEMIEGYRRLFNSTLDDVVKRIEKAKLEEKPSSRKEKVEIG